MGDGASMVCRLSPLRGSRMLWWILGGVASLLVLAGCGVEVQTRLDLAEAGSGTRTITLSAEAGVLGSTGTDPAGVERVILENLPGPLEYQGKKADASRTVFTFTLDFDSPEDYQRKVATVLQAGEIDAQRAEVRVQRGKPPFGSGMRWEEAFTSRDLMDWMVDALVAQNLLNQDQAGTILVAGNTVAVLEGQEHSTGELIRVGQVEDRGVVALHVFTDGLETEGKYVRTISYRLPAAAQDADPAGYEKFFRSVTPKGGEVTAPQGGDDTWTVRFPEGTAKQVAAWTDTALRTKGTVFDVTHATGDQGVLDVRTTVRDELSCTDICDPKVEITRQVAGPASWAGQNGRVMEDRARFDLRGESETIAHPITLERVEIALHLDVTGQASLQMRVVTPAGEDPRISAALVEWLRSGGEYRVEQTGDSLTAHEVLVDAADAQQLDASLRSFGFTKASDGPGALVEVTEGTGDLTTDRHQVWLDLGVPQALRVAGGKTPVTWSVRLEGKGELAGVEQAKPALGPGPNGSRVAASTLEQPTLTARLEVTTSRWESLGLALGVMFAALLAVVLVAVFVTLRLLALRRESAQLRASGEAHQAQHAEGEGTHAAPDEGPVGESSSAS